MLIVIDSSPCSFSLGNRSMFNYEMPSKWIGLKKMFLYKIFFSISSVISIPIMPIGINGCYFPAICRVCLLIADLIFSAGYYSAPIFFKLRSCKLSEAILRCSWFFTTRRWVLRFYRFLRFEEEYWDSTGFYDSKRSIDILPVFFLAESKFFHDLNFDFFLFELLPPFLIVEFCFRTLDFNSSFICNV